MVPASVEQLPRGTARQCKICSFGIDLPWGEVQGLHWDGLKPHRQCTKQVSCLQQKVRDGSPGAGGKSHGEINQKGTNPEIQRK